MQFSILYALQSLSSPVIVKIKFQYVYCADCIVLSVIRYDGYLIHSPHRIILLANKYKAIKYVRVQPISDFMTQALDSFIRVMRIIYTAVVVSKNTYFIYPFSLISHISDSMSLVRVFF